jgi:hypothetical protein
VLATAKKCKHCGEAIDVALRAAEEAKRQSSASAPTIVNTNIAVDRSPPAVYYVSKGRFPHLLHFALTGITCGIWLPVWIIHYLVTEH